MSHTTTIKTIVVNNEQAIRSAVTELNNQGIQCSLIENAKPRAYYENQSGMGKADLVIRLDKAQYDIGLYKQEDGTYELRTDFWAGSVEKVLGAQVPKGETDQNIITQAKLGKLYQAYALNAAEIAAQNQGYQTQRVNGTDGAVQIVVSGY